MASSIVPGNIDGTYPKSGQDNSSQGFRDNFNGIKNNFTTAASEITALQSNKASLNASSNFANNEVLKAKFKDTSEVVFAHGSVSNGVIILNHNNGHYHTATITADTTFSFTNFPAGALGRIVLDLTVAPTSTGILTFPSAVTKADNVTGSDGTSDSVTTGLGRVLYEFMSPDGGTTILMHQLGKQYA
mgnify:FL=1|jgi:hypothetical protein|tara:strand:+ start:1063 stop:1626 length:564 start_codon:yes stop_codon:yes gene_type:complete